MDALTAMKQALEWMEYCGDGDSPVAYDLRTAIEEMQKSAVSLEPTLWG